MEFENLSNKIMLQHIFGVQESFGMGHAHPLITSKIAPLIRNLRLCLRIWRRMDERGFEKKKEGESEINGGH